MLLPKRILISRTDSIGDVMLTLPLATILKEQLPDCYVGFLGKRYTQPVIECCTSVDEFIELDDFLNQKNNSGEWDAIIHVFPKKEIARKALQLRIPWRIGTSSRPYHWLNCNKLVRLKRRKSDLHEAQLNTKLLVPLGIDSSFSKDDLGKLYSFNRIPECPEELQALIEPGKKKIILHPKSQGSAREWGLDHFAQLVRLLSNKNVQVFISGTTQERSLMGPLFDQVGEHVTDICGKMNLRGFISFIARADALVAASTGPLHIAAALEKQAIGIYPPIRPMHPGRWAPLGPRAVALSLEKDCSDCKKDAASCHCIGSILPAEIAALLLQ
jgi:ADP-heptose:LPS heptosyltransferase